MPEEAGEFTAAEKAAMKARARELRSKTKVDGNTQVLDAIAEMSANDQLIANKLHELVQTHAPDLKPKTWYGMPAYARKDGKVVLSFQAASKWNSRLATVSFTEDANLDDGVIWPTAWMLTEINAAVEKQLTALIKRAGAAG